MIFELGPLKPQYYGLMYIIAFVVTYGLVVRRVRQESEFGISREQVADLTTAMIVGLIVGARLGYVPILPLVILYRTPLGNISAI